MITIQLGTIPARGTIDPYDTATATVGGNAYAARSRSSAVCKLTRLLRDSGAPDAPWIAITGHGTTALRGRSVYAMASRTISERDRGGMRWAAFKVW